VTLLKPTGSLKNNFIWTAFGKVSYAFSQWLIILIIARLLGVTALGEFSLAMAITTPIFIFASLQLPLLLATDATEQYSYTQYQTLNYFMFGFAIACSLLISWCFAYSSERVLIIFLLAIIKGFEMISEIHFSILRKNEQMKNIAVSLIIRGLLSITLFSITLYLTNSLLGSLLALIVVRLILLITFDRKKSEAYINKKTKPINVDKKIKVLMITSLPLGFVVLLDSLLSVSPRYFVEHFISVDALGYFTALASLLLVGGTIILSITQVITPRLSKYYNNRRIVHFVKLIAFSLLMSICISAVGLLLASLYGDVILGAFYGEDFADYNNVLWWLVIMTFVGFPTTILNSVLTSMRVIKIQPYLVSIALLVSISLSYLLVKEYAIFGIVWSMIAGWLVLLLGNIVFVFKHLKIQQHSLSH